MRNEAFFQFIWKQALYLERSPRTVCGLALEVIKSGEMNFNAGPDFLNARIRIGNLDWAGNVEIHSRSSDWEKHGHHLDPAYNNVILHVVGLCDSHTYNSLGQRIPCFVLNIPEDLQSRYDQIRVSNSWLPCLTFIQDLPRVHFQQWITSLQTERIAQKIHSIRRLLLHRNCDWDSAFVMVLAMGMGLPINCLPFELLLSGIPFEILHSNRDSRKNLEAILFGQAGFLGPGQMSGPYQMGLRESFKKLKQTSLGPPLSSHLWKFLRLRPASFPTIRISQLATLIHLRSPLMDHFLKSNSLTEIEQLLRVSASEYWNSHYLFGKCAPEQIKYLGLDRIHSVIVNSLVPFLFAYGNMHGKTALVEFGAGLLSDLRAESNQIIKNWIKFGIRPENAFESQALIQLHNVYCKQKRCFDCQIGAAYYKSAIHEKK
jgi:hypothetical protein